MCLGGSGKLTDILFLCPENIIFHMFRELEMSKKRRKQNDI